MIRTRVGYAGGEKRNPTYHSLGDHTETVQVDYDPNRISYADLLDIFWQAHEPSSRVWSRQYMNAVFYHNEDQRRLAEASKAKLAEQSGRKVRTGILPVNTFYRAEDYHQKYLLKSRSEIADELREIYPNSKAFTDSTATARLNGYVGGYGNQKRLEEEIERLGLSPQGRVKLRRLVSP